MRSANRGSPAFRGALEKIGHPTDDTEALVRETKQADDHQAKHLSGDPPWECGRACFASAMFSLSLTRRRRAGARAAVARRSQRRAGRSLRSVRRR
jgi:hypothetical protein